MSKIRMNDDFIIEAIGDKRIQCLEDLLEVTGYDKALREVIRSESNMRTTSMKMKDDSAKQIENLQIKAKLKPLSTLVEPNVKEILLKLFEGKIPTLTGPTYKDGPLLGNINHFDLHIDRLQHKGKKYLKEIDDRTMKLFELLMKHKPDKLLYINGGDYFNANAGDHKTAHGTPQDNYLSSKDSFKLGLEHQLKLIKTFSQEIPVDAYFLPGNHDLDKLQSLADAIGLYFSNTNNVTIDATTTPRKYLQWGKNSIGMGHGDDIKEKQIPLTMMNEFKFSLHNTYLKGHIHQRLQNEVGNLLIETFPSPAYPSDWELSHGYNKRGKIYGNLYDKNRGKVGGFAT